MRSLSLRKTLFLSGFVLVVLVNSVVLSRVAQNRAGTAEAQVVLTEREVSLPQLYNHENSGLSLRLKWRVPDVEKRAGSYPYWDSPRWFDRAKLEELGFSLSEKRLTGSWRHAEKKEVFIVLDSDSSFFLDVVDALEADLEKEKKRLAADPENQEPRDNVRRLSSKLEREKLSGSHLFAIDAGLDSGLLRQRYPDRSKYLLLKGVVSVHHLDVEGDKKKAFRGYITGINNDQIYVPRKYRQQLEELRRAKKTDQKGTRYRIQLSCGSLFEPWLTGVEKIDL